MQSGIRVCGDSQMSFLCFFGVDGIHETDGHLLMGLGDDSVVSHCPQRLRSDVVVGPKYIHLQSQFQDFLSDDAAGALDA